MKIVREHVNLNESLVGVWTPNLSDGSNQPVEVYKNPQTIKNMGLWCRAITDLKGNLYVADHMGMIHSHIYKFLIYKGELKGGYYDTYEEQWGFKNSLAWQRLAGTNKLYLSESYRWEIFDYNNKHFDYARELMIGWFRKVPKILSIKFMFEQIQENDHRYFRRPNGEFAYF